MEVTIDLKKLNSVEKYINLIDSMLNTMQVKKELDELIKLIIAVEKEYNYFKNVDKNLYKDIAIKIRGFIKNLIFNGNLPDSEYLYLYVIFDGLEIEEDEALKAQLTPLLNSLNNLEDNSIEKIITNEAIFLIDILNTDTKEGFKRYLKELMHVKVDLQYAENTRKFLVNFVEVLNLNFEDIKPVIDELFEKESYLVLPYEKQRSICNWTLHVIYNISNFFSTSKWTIFYPKWKKIFYEYLKNEEIDRALYLQFYIYHFMGNSVQDENEWKVFNEEINIPASLAYKKWGDKNNLPKPKSNIDKTKKIRIALLLDRIAFNSQFKVELSILRALKQNEEFNEKYEIGVYSANYFEKTSDNPRLIQAIKETGVEVFNPVSEFVEEGYYHSHLEKSLKLRETLINDEIDILITNMNGHGINTFLLTNRCAPKQVYFGHGELHFNIDGIDSRFMMGSVERAEEQILNGLKFHVYKNMMDMEFLAPNLDEEDLTKVEEIKANYPKNTIFLGTIGRVVKLDNKEYIKIVLEILKEYPNSVYLACGEGGEAKLKETLKEVNAKVGLENLEERFILTGLVQPHIYGNIMDIYLNSFPQPQGASLLEIMAKGKAVVSMYLKDWEEINKLVPKESMTYTLDEYKELASKAITNRKSYNKLARESKKSALKYVDLKENSKSLVEILNKIVQE